MMKGSPALDSSIDIENGTAEFIYEEELSTATEQYTKELDDLPEGEIFVTVFDAVGNRSTVQFTNKLNPGADKK